MKLVTVDEMRLVEERAAKDYGMTGGILMETAGKDVAEAVLSLFNRPRLKAAVVSGLGKNGGDGMVAARYLANAGAEVTVVLLGKVTQVAAEAARALVAVQSMAQAGELVLLEWHEGTEVSPEVLRSLASADVVVDAILGIGKKGLLKEHVRKAIAVVNRARRPAVAVDVPSGLDADTGAVEAAGYEGDRCVKAQVTVAMISPKVGLYREPGSRFAGKIRVAGLGLPRHLLEEGGLKTDLITPDMMKELLPPRPSDAHKGLFGHVVVMGGSPGMSGSVSLAGEAAIRTGAGLVTVAVPQGIQAEVAAHRAEYMTLPLPQTGDGTLAEAAGGWVAHIMEGKNIALVLGPGMRILETGPGIIKRLLESSWPLVLDADALNTMAQNPKDYQPLIGERGGAVVMTPHPGELGRLMGVPAELIQSDRLAWARRAAAEWGAVVVLKGAGTVVASPQGDACLNINGGPWLATGGTGDVLTGIIAALLAQGLAPLRAAAAGVFLHGAAGDLTVKEEENEIMAAGDLPGRIGRVWTALARGNWSEKGV